MNKINKVCMYPSCSLLHCLIVNGSLEKLCTLVLLAATGAAAEDYCYRAQGAESFRLIIYL